MTTAGLVLASLSRHRVRTALTVLSVLVACILFGYLAAIRKAFEMGVEVAGADRLVVRHRVSIIQPLPASYEADIERIRGVEDATPASWFGGIYQDPRNFFAQFPVVPREFLAMYPEILLDEDEIAAWEATRTGAVVGVKLAERFGWEIGDTVPIQATIWRPKDGTDTWTFEVVGIYEGATPEFDTTMFLFRNDYFDENRAFGEGLVGWYYMRVADPARAPEIAEAVDAEFANSPAETKTESEGAFVQAFADQVGNVGAIVTAIVGAVFVTILLVAGNAMAQGVRERTAEIGVLKALGFSDGRILRLVLAESLLVAGLGGGLGLLIAWLVIAKMGDPTGGLLAVFFFPREDVAIGALLVVLLGLAAGLLPALAAMRLDPVTALRREG